jgi:hypothetical protein
MFSKNVLHALAYVALVFLTRIIKDILRAENFVPQRSKKMHGFYFTHFESRLLTHRRSGGRREAFSGTQWVGVVVASELGFWLPTPNNFPYSFPTPSFLAQLSATFLHGVVMIKSIFVRGTTNKEGFIETDLSQNINVRVGRWEHCADSLVIGATSTVLRAISISSSYVSCFEADSNERQIRRPAKLCVFHLDIAAGKKQQCIHPGRKEWLFFENAVPEHFRLIFQDAEDGSLIEGLKISAVVLFRRLDDGERKLQSKTA